MARSPGESKIPVFHTNPLKSKISKPLSSLSSRVRAHLDASKSRASSSVIFGILSATGGSLKNVTVNKSLNVSQFGNNLSSSHDDLKPKPPRPTNIFLKGRFFPTTNKKVESTIGTEHIGKRVRLSSGKEGVLQFIGKTQFGEGTWCGVELDHEDGSTDGVVNNVKYFNCDKNRGVFALAENVDLVQEVREYLSDVSDSGPHSLLGITGDLEQVQNDSMSAEGYFRKDNVFRYSGSHLQQSSQLSTPTPNSSNSSYAPLGEWKCNSQHSSSAGSLALSHCGVVSGMDALSSFHLSKHSSFECEESLGILTPDQMGELTTCSGDALGAVSCDDLSAFTFQENSDSLSKTDICSGQVKFPSLSNIVDVPSTVENSEECCFLEENIADTTQNELMEKLFSETDTCMLSVSSISDHIEQSKKFDNQRTPSFEELPVDDLSTTLVPEQENPIDIPIPAPSTTSFVTSVTSIGSWDNGYQGDGECSRPTSRGADASPLARVPKTLNKALDPMTDSDFYTESDADLYEDVSCLRGDRKARVIDGKLFGSPGKTTMITSQSYGTVITSEVPDMQHERNPPSEEMDSSGIYSDLEKRIDADKPMEVGNETPVPEEIHSDTSGNSSSKSVSSQKLVVCDEKSKSSEISDKDKSKPAVKEVVNKTSKVEVVHQKQENGLKRRNDRNIVNSLKKENIKGLETPINKPKMPRRNVTSKVKSMIACTSKGSEDENQENRQPVTKNIKKTNGKWDSVVSKIEKSRNDDKSKSEKLKDVKSKVACGMPRASSKLHKDVKPFSSNSNSINKVAPSKTSTTLSGSTRSLKECNGHRVKTRKPRRIGIDSPVQSTATVPASISQASSRNSSVTDISDSHVDISQHSLPAVVITSEFSRGKKTSSLLCSPLSEGSVPCVPIATNQISEKDVKISTLPRTKTNLKQTIGSVNSLIENSAAMKVPKKSIHRRTLPKVVPLRDQNRIVTGSAGSCSVAKSTLKPLVDHGRNDCKSKAKTKPPTQISKVNPLLSQLKYTTNGMEAFIILFQRLTADMDVFTLPCIKRELFKYKSEWLEMKLKLEEADVSCKRLKEEIEMLKIRHEHNIEEMREIHTEQLNRLKGSHQVQLGEHSKNYERQLKLLEDNMKEREKHLQRKFHDDLKTIQRQAELKLENILEETKRQVENLKIENDGWKEKLRNEYQKDFEEMERKVRSQIEQMESKHEEQLNAASEEIRKREEQFVAFSNKRAEKRKLSRDDTKHTTETIPHGFKVEFQNLEEEVCSLRTVLELKHSEIQDLRKQNEKLHREAQDLPFVMQKLDSAQARVEDLNAQLQTKIENEKKLLKENRKLLESVHSESEKKKRLAFQNEELLWKLKNSTQVAKALALFNSNNLSREEHVSEPEVSHHSTPIRTRHCHKQLNFDLRSNEKLLRRSRTDNDIKIESPTQDDVSSKVLGVVEKSDSVSWVLDLDESPIAVASRMLRRANSLRGVPSKKKASHDRPLLTLPTRSKKHDLSSSDADSTTTSKVDFGVQCCDISSASDQSNLTGDVLRSETHVDSKVEILDDQNNFEKNNELRDDDENVILDISSIFDFLQDADFETDNALTSETNEIPFYSTDKELRSPFSSSSGSSSSLDLEVFGKEMKSLAYTRFVWTGNEGKNVEPVEESSSTSPSASDIEDSEGTDISNSSFIADKVKSTNP